jgi:hypothetical protein
MQPFRYLTALLMGAVVVTGAMGDEPKKDKPKNDQPPAFPDIDAFLKKLPSSLDPKQIDEIKKMLEQARDAQKRAMKLADEARAKGAEEARKAIEEARRAVDNFEFRPLQRRFGNLLPSHGRLGVMISPPSPTIIDQFNLEKDRGLVIVEVRPDSPAARAGLKLHDILVEFNGKPVPASAEEFAKQVEEIKADARVDAVVFRKGKKETIKDITLPEAPKTPERPRFRPGPGATGPFGRGDELSMLSITRDGDRIIARQREGGTSITLTAKTADGKLTVESIAIRDDSKSEKYNGIDKVPEKYRDKVKALLVAAEKATATNKGDR